MASPKPPKVPNPQTLTTAQEGQNTQVAQQNQSGSNYNTQTPYGDFTYTLNPATNTWQVSETYSPSQQGLLNQQIQTQGQAGAEAGNVLANASATGSLTPNFTAPGAVNTIASLEAPAFNTEAAQQFEQLNSNLNNEGLFPGSTGYNQSVNNFETGIGNAWGNVLAQGANTGLNAEQLGATVPLQEVASLEGLGSPTQPTQISGSPLNIQPTNVAGISQEAFNEAQQNYQQQVAQSNAEMGGLFGLGGAALQAGAYPGIPTGATLASGAPQMGSLFGALLGLA